MKQDQLSDAERKLFMSLEQEKEPPEGLEEKIVNHLKKDGQIANFYAGTYLKWAVSIAASVLIFLAGMYFEKLNVNDMATIEPAKGYMLLLHEDQHFIPGEPMEMFEEYSRWMESAFERGMKITGQELKSEAAVVNAQEQVTVQTAGKRTTGYFILEANSMEEAIEVAKSNPHIKYGGTIEIKPFMVR